MRFGLVLVAVRVITVMAAADGGTTEAAAGIASDDDECALRISAFALGITTATLNFQAVASGSVNIQQDDLYM
ncbi:MAG: hypothetical protein ABI977_07425 [Acidobacteriota bacterium]